MPTADMGTPAFDPASGYASFKSVVDPVEEQYLGHPFTAEDWYNQNAPNFASDSNWANEFAANVPGSQEAQTYLASLKQQQAPAPSAPAPSAPAPSAPAAPAYTPPPVQPDAASTANNQALRDFMTGQLAQLSTPTDANSADIAPALQAYSAQSQRDQQTARDALAENYYATGGEGGAGIQSGGFQTALQQNLEAGAANRANFAGSTIYNASQAKRQQLQAMLQTAVGAGQTDTAQQIQAQIANIDANLREQGLTQQNQQFNDQLSYNYANTIAGLNRDVMLQALTG